jgi:hemoglobin-like flavoprotein
MVDADLITRALEIAGKRRGDITQLVYARLFADYPDMEALFVRDQNGLVRGEMLARVFEALLDFVDRRAYAAQMIQCEVITHEGYGVPPDVFPLFFVAVADTLEEILGADWTPAMAEAWRELLAQTNWYATHTDQTAIPQFA